MSFQRRRESRKYYDPWTPACAHARQLLSIKPLRYVFHTRQIVKRILPRPIFFC